MLDNIKKHKYSNIRGQLLNLFIKCFWFQLFLEAIGHFNVFKCEKENNDYNYFF